MRALDALISLGISARLEAASLSLLGQAFQRRNTSRNLNSTANNIDSNIDSNIVPSQPDPLVLFVIPTLFVRPLVDRYLHIVEYPDMGAATSPAPNTRPS
jgi:hypothetical protein